jgi:hypothetical protein
MSKKQEKFRIRASADAPDFVAHGNLEAEKVGGYYETGNERFAEHLKAEYGATSKPAAKPKTKKKPAKSGKTASAKSPAKEAAPPAEPVEETKPETTGGNE